MILYVVMLLGLANNDENNSRLMVLANRLEEIQHSRVQLKELEALLPPETPVPESTLERFREFRLEELTALEKRATHWFHHSPNSSSAKRVVESFRRERQWFETAKTHELNRDYQAWYRARVQPIEHQQTAGYKQMEDEAKRLSSGSN